MGLGIAFNFTLAHPDLQSSGFIPFWARTGRVRHDTKVTRMSSTEVIVGRREEQASLTQFFNSPSAEFLAV